MITINKNIIDILLSNTGLTSYVNNKIYPLIAPENTTSPFIVTFHDNIDYDYAKFDDGLTTVYQTIIIISETYSESLNITEKVIEILNNYKDEYINKIRVTSSEESYLFDDYSGGYMQQLKLKIII